MKTATYQMEELSCPSCIKKIEKALSKQEGVEDVKVLFNSGKVKVTYQEGEVNPNQYKEILTKLGYPVLSTKIN
ncbi:heavy-metal-associated domain-containing protein [Bacillus sinesaloumensis]|uniref:heavy-metal-associated domain-containing protein n=1 Tax=Litchfieldia sinesaloumensis TaxID=1926280 RepID=UPI000988907F|nr:heavy-metal-associated domain-containing protein [Bacillus sinesaloumensis]